MTYYEQHKEERKAYQKAHYVPHKKEAKACQQAHREKIAKYQKAYHKTYSQSESRRKIKAEYRQDYPEKTAAHNVLNSEIRSGRLKRSVFCEDCGLPAKTEGHHEDYSKPLEVDWLCRKCHAGTRKK